MPLDIASAVPTDHNYGRLTVRVEGLPSGARLTKGQNNGDQTWSLNIDELTDLKYVPPYGGFISHTLWIRILALDDGFANTVRVFALEVDPDALPPRMPDLYSRETGAVEPAPVAAARRPRTEDASAELDALKAELAAQKKAAAEAGKRLEEARAAWQQESEKKLAEAQAAWRKDADRMLAEAQDAWKKKAAGEVEQVKAETEAALLKRVKAESGARVAEQAARAEEVSELEKRLRTAETKAGEGSKSAAATIADLQTRLKTAEKALEAARKRAADAEAAGSDSAGAVADLKAQVKAANAALQKTEARATAAEKATQAADAKLVDAMAKLARADDAASKNKSASDQVKALEAELAKREKAHEAALTKARTETQKAVDAEYSQALDALRREHAEELKRKVAEERDTLSTEFEARMTALQAELEQSADKRVGAVEDGIQSAIAEACATAVAEARADWEKENERNLAQASEAWKRDQDQRLAAARVEWEGEQQDALEAARSEWLSEQETAVAAAVADVRAEHEALLAEKESAWQLEMEQRLADVQSDVPDALERRIEEARAEWERAHEAALIERDDAWRDHEAKVLEDARTRWQAEEEQRLAAAREAWQRSFAAQAPATPAPSVETAPPPVPELGPAGEPILTLQDRLPETPVTPGQSRSGRRKGALSKIMRRLYAATIGMLPVKQMVRVGAALGLIAGGWYAYPHVKPVYEARVVPITSTIAAKVQGIGERMFSSSGSDEVKVSPLVGRRLFIRPSAANLRKTPTTGADVVDTVERATVVEILAVKGSWMRVRTIGRSVQEGWIHKSLLADKPYG